MHSFAKSSQGRFYIAIAKQIEISRKVFLSRFIWFACLIWLLQAKAFSQTVSISGYPSPTTGGSVSLPGYYGLDSTLYPPTSITDSSGYTYELWFSASPSVYAGQTVYLFATPKPGLFFRQLVRRLKQHSQPPRNNRKLGPQRLRKLPFARLQRTSQITGHGEVGGPAPTRTGPKLPSALPEQTVAF